MMKNKKNQMKLIGGQKLKDLGSDRNTLDTDFLVYFEDEDQIFIKAGSSDLINAAAQPMLRELWAKESADEISLSGLFTLCAWAFVNHCQNGNFRKADAKEYDLKFLSRLVHERGEEIDLGLLEKHLHHGELAEVKNVMENIRK